MKNILFGLLMVVCYGTLFAQEKPAAYILEEGYDFWMKEKGDTAHVFADVAYIRDYPGTKGKLLDSIPQETLVIIKSDCYNNSTARGFEAPWRKISYIKEGKQKEGFIWSGLLAIGRMQHKDGTIFSVGFLRRDKETSYSPEAYMLQIKCFDTNHNLQTKVYYPAGLSEQRYSEHKLLPNMGLEGLENIIRIGFLGEACGIPSEYYYFSWNGNEIIPMFNRYTVGDAGIYHHEEKILFPSEHNLDKNLIIKDIEEGEVIDEDAQDYKYKTTRKRVKYIWNGKVASELIEMKAVN
ncbi:hypothetical protein [Sphingobacterium yanglingense]|uniref:SH3 domain-containing protein n=1 Tax=Sphingobacterium yanglingense TaxID=1437280 RepID=A0A4R6WG55_9SPHI|nr:hypothetical protein [Sphingobacterium yanglingense]TDQ77163.1 hypothetical protein CLV99_2561 [Sphingobacterium yanglingense]